MSDAFNEFVAGTFGGFVGKIVEHPMDTVKVIMQTRSQTNPNYTNSWECCKHLYTQSGMRGFYRGLATPLLGSMAEISTLMTTYGFFKRMLGERPGGDPLPAWKLAIASGGSGIGVSCVLTPVELIKCKLQVQNGAVGGTTYRGPIHLITEIVKNEGLLGLTRGLFPTLCREIPGNVAWFGAYETVCSLCRDKENPEAKLNPGIYMLAGACAGISYWSIPFPADTVKSRIQTAPPGKHLKFWSVFLDILKMEGVRGLYRGWLVTVLRAAPANAAVFYSYEMCMQAMGEGDHSGHPALDSQSKLDLNILQETLQELQQLKEEVAELKANEEGSRLKQRELYQDIELMCKTYQSLAAATAADNSDNAALQGDRLAEHRLHQHLADVCKRYEKLKREIR